MKKREKVVSFALSVIMATGILSGCGSTDNTDVKKVTIWSDVGSSKAFWTSKVEEFNNSIGKEKGIEIVFEATTDSGYSQKIDIAMQSDELPDLFAYGNLKKAVEMDRVAPIDDIPGVEDLVEKYKDRMVETVTKMNGRVYCIPSDVMTRGLIYNKDMFKAAGIVDENGEAKPPKTLAEFRECAMKLTDASKDQYGVVFPLKWRSWVESDVLGVTMTSTGMPSCYNPVEKTYDYMLAAPILEVYLAMKEDGSVFPGELSLDNDPARARFAEGGIGMKLSYSFDVGVFKSQFIPNFEWDVAPLPVLDEENSYKQLASYGAGMKVSKKGLERLGEDVIGTVLSWWYSDENFIEGYKQGLIMPPDWDMIADVEVSDDLLQWKKFCSMQDISVATPLYVPSNMDGKKTIAQVIIDDIWTKGASLDVLNDFTKDTMDGIEKYKELNPDFDYSIYNYDEWDAKR